MATERIATALERIAVALESQVKQAITTQRRSNAGKKQAVTRERDHRGHFISTQKHGKTPATSSKAPPLLDTKVQINQVIAAYVKAWQARYGTRARPDVGGKSQGILRRLARDLTTGDLVDLVQVYCQLDNPWFLTKRHDLATFEQNLNNVTLALDKGHESTDINYAKVFGDSNDQGKLLEAGGQDEVDLGTEQLPNGENLTFLEDATNYE